MRRTPIEMPSAADCRTENLNSASIADELLGKKEVYTLT